MIIVGKVTEEGNKVYVNGDEILPTTDRSINPANVKQFAWGYLGQGPSMLAKTLVLELTGNDEELMAECSSKVKEKVIAALEFNQDFKIDSNEITKYFN
jgi:hypothetical protein